MPPPPISPLHLPTREIETAAGRSSSSRRRWRRRGGGRALAGAAKEVPPAAAAGAPSSPARHGTPSIDARQPASKSRSQGAERADNGRRQWSPGRQSAGHPKAREGATGASLVAKASETNCCCYGRQARLFPSSSRENVLQGRLSRRGLRVGSRARQGRGGRTAYSTTPIELSTPAPCAGQRTWAAPHRPGRSARPQDPAPQRQQCGAGAARGLGRARAAAVVRRSQR